MTGTVFKLEVNPKIPARLEPLEDLAGNLWYSWDRSTRSLFAQLSDQLWKATNHNPKAFLKRADQKGLEAAAENPVFLGSLNRVISAYSSYHELPNMAHVHGQSFKKDDLIAYFCAEFGFHESLPIYSGGLGILAGDHCKGASDMGLPFIGVGLLYRQGYFHQTLDADGTQQAAYSDSDFDDLPISPLHDANGQDVVIAVEFPGRTVHAKVWEVRVGHVRLVLLDTWLPQNSVHDREITHRLYGGDRTARIEQEILLGVGGVRALAVLGLKPTVWHVNEGHAAFLILERIRSLVAGGLPYAAAIEAVAANVVFTTHTPVPAGHDHFSEEMMRHYFSNWCHGVGVPCESLLGLGAEPGKSEFNMTALALRGSRQHNGVSRIHGDVSATICRYLWPQIEPEENPMDYITNGVHLPTFLATEWHETFERYLGTGWRERQTEPDSWDGIARIPDQTFWSIRQQLKSQLLQQVCVRIREQHQRNQGSPSHVDRLLKFADPHNPNILTIGFARRFATYKRAALLFQNPERLAEIISQAGTAGPLPVRRQGPPGRQAGPGPDPQDRRDGQAPGIRGPHPACRRLRPASGAHIGRRRRCLAQQPDLPARSVRHLGHEGGDERRAESLGARRLVGRRLRRQRRCAERLDDQAGAGPPRRCPARRRGSAHALRTPAGPHHPDLLPHRSPGLLAGMGGDGQALDHDDLAPLQRHPHGRRVRQEVLCAGRHARSPLRQQ